MSEFWFDLVKMVVVVVAAIIGVVITTYVIPWVTALKNDSRYAQLFAIIEAGVKAAEQVITTPHSGAEKKQRVIEFVSAWLMERGISITSAQLSELIEAAVFNMHLEQGQEIIDGE